MNSEKIYIVKEQWQNNCKSENITKHAWFIVGADEVIFDIGSNEERLQNANSHLAERFRYIATRRCLSGELRQSQFAITLICTEQIDGASNRELVLEVNETNYPIPEELREGLFRMKSRN
jgi:hypothetical protein